MAFHVTKRGVSRVGREEVDVAGVERPDGVCARERLLVLLADEDDDEEGTGDAVPLDVSESRSRAGCRFVVVGLPDSAETALR